jgi:phage/plasmid-associated DNA primase
LIFSANQIPVTSDETDAFSSRLIIINFPNQLLVDKADPSLVEKLTTDKELSDLLEVILKRLPRVLEKGIYVPEGTMEQKSTINTYKVQIQSEHLLKLN